MFKYISVAVLLGVVYAGPEKNPLCTSSNGYYPVDENCDAYIECKDYIAREMICPDGLHYNPQAEWPAYPCAYPMDAPCHGRGAPQQAQPTADCPHQHGFFPLPNADAMPCDSYRMCVEGKAIEMQCPPGVAFNPDSGRCDWHVLDPSCGAERKYKGNCYAFYSCEHGRLRFLTCNHGFAFDSARDHCVDEREVQCAVPLTQH